MSEPIAPAVLGIKYATLAAGFAGGVVSLSFIVGLTKAQMISAVATGALTSGYLTPIAVELGAKWFAVTPAVEGAVGFFIGLCAMNIIPGLLALSKKFRDDPTSLWSKRS